MTGILKIVFFNLNRFNSRLQLETIECLNSNICRDKITKNISELYEVMGLMVVNLLLIIHTILWLHHLIFSSAKAVVGRCSVKKMLLEISQNLQEHTCARVSF